MKSIVLLSGGLDSTVALVNAICSGHKVSALSFYYGQTHARELRAAKEIAELYRIPHRVIDLTGILSGVSALTGQLNIPTGHAETADATFVPARNLVMLSAGVAAAEATGAGSVVIGANADDNNGYIDCRPKFIEAFDVASREGTVNLVTIWSPLIRMTKKEIVKFGKEIGAPIELTWSCYRGGEKPCLNCGACESREGAFK